MIYKQTVEARRLMSHFLKEIFYNKLKTIASDDIISYGQQYGFQLTKKQAQAIIHYVQTHSPDPFHSEERAAMLRALAEITDTETAKKANHLFWQAVKAYGLEHMFK